MLRQIYHNVKQTSAQTGRNCCLLLDAMSGRSKLVYLEIYNADDKLGASVRIGRTRGISNAVNAC